jgi:hypothetical protein
MLPDFLIIGAPKAGTTWLVSCLRRHPDVFIPLEELHYWTTPALLGETHAWYQQKFESARPGQLIGENSNSYLIRPEAAQRIYRHLPAAKLITVLRNPVDRAYSGYCMRLRYGDVAEDIERFLDPDRSTQPDILRNSLYYQKLGPYLACFPRSQMHFLIFDDVRDRPGEALAELCRFLGVAPRVDEMLIEEKINARERPWPAPGILRALRTSDGLRSLARNLKGTKLHGWIRAALTRELRYPALTPQLRQRMSAYFRDDVEQLSRLVGRDLGVWLRENEAGSQKAAGTAVQPQS